MPEQCVSRAAPHPPPLSPPTHALSPHWRPPRACCRAAALMSSIYEDHRDEDGFLYITYSGENTFGAEQEELGAAALGLELMALQL